MIEICLPASLIKSKKLKSLNKKIIIISSGAIALGCKKINHNKSNLKLDKSQAIASIGQIELMNLFSQTFLKYKLNISQILLTLDDTEERRRSINAKRTFENLFQLDYIPIVNENDLINALNNRIISFAALDVYDQEPLPKEHILRKTKNTILTPHIGYVSSEAYEKFFNGYLKGIEAFINKNPINQIS